MLVKIWKEIAKKETSQKAPKLIHKDLSSFSVFFAILQMKMLIPSLLMIDRTWRS